MTTTDVMEVVNSLRATETVQGCQWIRSKVFGCATFSVFRGVYHGRQRRQTLIVCETGACMTLGIGDTTGPLLVVSETGPILIAVIVRQWID
jgi:hypothetical protein